jgi:HKD family nuclease
VNFFTEGIGTTLESELRKEILSSDKIDLLVSFQMERNSEFLKKNSDLQKERNLEYQLHILVQQMQKRLILATLENTEVKVSYNTANERLHAKAYLFQRNTGFYHILVLLIFHVQL